MAEDFDQKGELHQFNQERVSTAFGVAGIGAKELQEVHNSDKGKAEAGQRGVAEAEEADGEVIFAK